jgi:hypothetical protein
MTQFEGQGLALACFVAVIVAGGLALLGHLRAAAALNGALAVLFLVLAAPSLIGWALRPDAYVQRYGRAALNELPRMRALLRSIPPTMVLPTREAARISSLLAEGRRGARRRPRRIGEFEDLRNRVGCTGLGRRNWQI